MKTKRANRLLALLLALVMVAGVLPMSVLAAGEDETAPARYEYVLDTDGIDDGGVYAIYTNYDADKDRLLYYGGSSELTDMLTATLSQDKSTLALNTGSQFPANTQLWQAVAVDGGFALQSLAGGYLKVKSSATHAHIDVSDTEQALTITAHSSSAGRYKVTQDGWSLNWGSNKFYTHNADNGYYVRFFKQTPVWTVTFTGEGVTESTAEVLDGGNATLPAGPSREGYTFQGWFVGEDEFTAETAVTANITATAQWEEISVEPEVPEEPETPEKTRYYFESVDMDGGAWKISDGSVPNPNTMEVQTDSGWVSATEIVGGADRNYRLWAPGPGYLNFDKVGDVLLTNKLRGGQNAASIQFEKQNSDVYLISYVKDGTTYYLTAENQTSNGQDRAVFSSNKADAVPYFVEAESAGSNTYRIYCEGLYTVSFSGEGAEDIPDMEAMYGTTLPTPADREGYTFLGWFDGETQYTEATADVTVTAQWEPIPAEIYTPAKAEAEGKIVTYLGMAPNMTAGNRHWDGVDASSVRGIELYQAAGEASAATTGTGIALDTDGVDSGKGYVIYIPDSSKSAVMHYSDPATNQCSSINATVQDLLHLFVFETEGDGYTIRPVGQAGKYLSLEASGSQQTFKEEKTVFYVTPVNETNDGTYYIWTATEPGPIVMAQTKFSGTSDKPMDRLHILDQDDDVDTEYRIPALVTLDNGWIVAACDIRWSSTQDSPNNLDTIVSISKDGGETWEWEVVNYFSDFAPVNGGGQRANSASFIDPALLVDSDGTLWMAVDLQPTNVNLGKDAQKTGSGFDEEGLLMVAPISEAEWATKVNTSLGRTEATRLEYQAQYAYRVDINGVNEDSVTATAAKDGKNVTLYAIFHMDTKENTGYYVDAFFDLYYDYGEDGIQPVIVAQKESTEYVQANLFYLQSPWKAYSTTYLMIRKATVEGDGLAWGDPQLISGVKNFDGETFLAFCPGRGTAIQVTGENGETVERIIFPVYDNVSSERASAVYSDDGGVTWHRGARVENDETRSNSESQIVELHDAEGNPFLRMFSRNTGNPSKYVSYADSFDNGLTWTATKYDQDMPNGEGTMMSFIGLKGFLMSPEGAVYEDVVLASYPRGSASNRRTNGIVRLGYYDAENGAMVWLNDKDDIRYPYKFTYSCLTQLRDEDGFTDGFALLYEDERNWASHYGMEMGFDTFTTADLLGEGWVLVQTKPTEDRIIVTPIAKQPYTGEAIEPAVTVYKNGEVTEDYELEYLDNTEVGTATVNVLMNGEIVATVTFEIEEVIVLPDEYTILSVIRDQAYTGSPITPAVTVLKNGEVTEDYELEYLDNTEVGTATVNVLVDGEIVASVEFEIIGGVEQADVYTMGDIAARVYSGEAIEPVVTVYKNGALMPDGYTVTYENNVNVGTATVIVLVNGAEVVRGTFRITEVASSGTGTASRPVQSAVPEQPTDPVEDLDDPDVPLAGLPMNFEDVTRDDWFYNAVQYVFDEELMGGVSSAAFAPNSNTTRAQIVTILYRLEDKPEVEEATFADVESGEWYAESAAWGQMAGVVTGVGGGNFRPTRDVTREELMVFLYRYAKYKALDVTAAGDLSVFQDGATTSDWAVEAMIWAVGAGLIRGKGEDRLDPAETATRAEVATILMRFCEDFMK